eukprot:CAMPEP_0168560888 /NCGR_PEP_ID=MMETSP0413-20121227/11301_1 /TAXON_ID=136452 /ORGANISM="Filamoeba nolandi, Strain NC-AS-23-1" /LENGTH=1108 /DNA_ID=CAMNT_0008592221 /DNA_START=186 /DNA_END=3513 /DNA_ORIENTATION=-
MASFIGTSDDTSSIYGEDDELGFHQEIIHVAKKIVIEVRKLKELGENLSSEEALLEGAKNTALATFELSDLVVNHIQSKNETNELSVGDKILLDSSKGVRSGVINFIDAIKTSASNPFDYLSKQNVENTQSATASPVPQANEQFTYNLVQDVKQANMMLQAFSEAVDHQDPQKFAQCSKDFVGGMNQLISISAELEAEAEDNLRESTVQLIQTAKNVVTAAQPNDPVVLEPYHSAKMATINAIKMFLFATAKSAKGVKRQSWNLIMPKTDEPGRKGPALSEEDQMKRAVANKIVKQLTDSFQSFRQEWQSATQQPKLAEVYMLRIINEFTPLVDFYNKQKPAPSENNNNVLIDDSNDMAMKELKRIMTMESTKDWQKISKELKTLTRKLDKSGNRRRTSTIGTKLENIDSELRDCAQATGDLENEVIVIVTELASVLLTSTAETASPAAENTNQLAKVVGGFLEVLEASFRIAKVWMHKKGSGSGGGSFIGGTPTNSQSVPNLGTIKGLKETIKLNKSQQINTSSLRILSDEMSQKYKAWVEAYLSESAKVVKATAERGTPLQDIIMVLAEYDDSNVEKFISIQKSMEESLQYKIQLECEMIRVLTIQLMSTLNALSVDHNSHDFTTVLQLGALCRTMASTISSLLNVFETLVHINAKHTQLRRTSSADQLAPKILRRSRRVSMLPNDEENIWKDKSQLIKDKDGSVAGGTLNQIMIYLTTVPDTNFLKTFLITYQSFATPWAVLQKLEQRYQGPKDDPKFDANEHLKIKLRVGVVLKYWIETQFHDFDMTLVEKLGQFLERIKNDSVHAKQMSELATRLSQELIKKNSANRQSVRINTGFDKVSIDIKVPEGNISPVGLFLRFSESEIARQLTVLEFNIFKNIRASELVNQAWNKPKLQYRAPNIGALISRANKISFWVASLIVWQAKLADRVKILEKYIKIALHLKELNNFNTLISVIAGLNISAVSRLKHTWDQVEKGSAEALKKMQETFNPANSFKIYRQARYEATSKGPVMPYIGVPLSDLTFAEDGNPDHLQNDPNIINVSKREIIGKIIMDLQLNQQQSYSIPVVEPVHTFLTDLPYSNEKDLYDLSLLREPRGSVLAQLQ